MFSSAPDMVLPTQKIAAPPRYLLWIDGVAGYLLCLAPRITLGHAGARPVPDVPLLADVSRLHALLERDAEGYTLQAFRATRINGQEVERALLRSGDRVTLGASCQLLFDLPVAVSASARLELMSGHRLAYPVSNVLLMADTLVLAEDSRGHVTVPALERPGILYRQNTGLAIRHDRGITTLEPGKSVALGEVSITLERV